MKSQVGDGASHVPDGDGASQIPDQWLQLRQPLLPSDAVSSATNFPAPTSSFFRQFRSPIRNGNQQPQIRNFRRNPPPGPNIRPLANSNFRDGIGPQNGSVLRNNRTGHSGDRNRSSSPSNFRRINSSAPPKIRNQIPPATGIHGTRNNPNQTPSNITVMRCPNCSNDPSDTERQARKVETQLKELTSMVKLFENKVLSDQSRLFQQSEKIEKMAREQSAALAEVQAAASSREAAILSSLERLAGKKTPNRIGNSGNDDKNTSGISNRSSSPLTFRRVNSNRMPEKQLFENTNSDYPVPNYQIPEAAEIHRTHNLPNQIRYARNVEMQSDQLKFIAETFENQISAHFKQFMEKFEKLERERKKREMNWWVAEARAIAASTREGEKNLEQVNMLSLLERLVGEKILVAGNSSGRWSPEEVMTLIELKGQMDNKCRELGWIASMWEEISVGMEKYGFKRDARSCKEKWDSIFLSDQVAERRRSERGYKKESSKSSSYFKNLRKFNSSEEMDAERLLVLEMVDNGDPSTSSAHQNNVEEEEKD